MIKYLLRYNTAIYFLRNIPYVRSIDSNASHLLSTMLRKVNSCENRFLASLRNHSTPLGNLAFTKAPFVKMVIFTYEWNQSFLPNSQHQFLLNCWKLKNFLFQFFISKMKMFLDKFISKRRPLPTQNIVWFRIIKLIQMSIMSKILQWYIYYI